MSEENVDTRVTAYVFGELSPEATAAFERELDKSRALEEEVLAVREAIHALESDFAAHATPLSDAQNAAIEQAIARRGGSAPTPPPPVVRRASNVSYPNQRLAIFAVLAASAVIVTGLVYPYLRSRDATPISMNDQPPSELSSEVLSAAQREADAAQREADQEVATLVATFNDLVGDNRYEEAEVIAREVAEIQPDSPISAVMLQTSQSGRQLAGQVSGQSVELLADAASPAPRALGMSNVEANEQPGGEAMNRSQNLPPSLSGAIDSELDDLFGDSEAADSDEAATRGGRIDIAEEQPEIALQKKGARGTSSAAKSNLSSSGRREQPNPGLADSDFDAIADQAQSPRRGSRSAGAPAAEMDEMSEMMEGMDMEMGMGEMMEMDSGAMGMAMGGMGGGAGMGMGDARGGAAEMGLGMGMDMMGIANPGERQFALGDQFDPIDDNEFVDVLSAPLSTFSIDVDTASYSKVRSLLRNHSLPRPDAVRIEEMLNYFDYDYPTPVDEHPFAASMEVAECPWNPEHRLARIGIKGKNIETQRPSSNLVFLLDVSGSMDEPNKLPLVIEGMKMLTDQLSENDKVAIVVYAGAAGLVLDATRGDKKQQIVAALDRLHAGGSTNGGQGILLAYEIARDNFIAGGTNRVILCSDGDFNVGVTGTNHLVEIAQENAKSNIFLTVLGFGIGNHNDAMMEQISNKGNGNYAFIDTKSEAKKVLVEELGGTLVTIAKDVKIQIEFNPKEVASYRLIGYENRVLAAQDFNDDKKDAGEIGAGHTVTALYEVVPAENDDADVPAVDELRYQQRNLLRKEAESGEMLVLKLRYKQPEGDKSTLVEVPVRDSGKRFAQTDRDFQFAASVASFGMLLRNSPHRGNATFASTLGIAREGAKGDDFGYRQEFVELVEIAKDLRGE